jgi:hypothetical protein
MALLSGVAGVNNRRSELNKEDVTGILLKHIYLYLILSHKIMKFKTKVIPLARIIGKALRIIP